MQSFVASVAVAACLANTVLTAVAPPNTHVHSKEWKDELEAKFAQRNDHLYVHIIPHSHDDVGWLKTPDEYFTGSNQSTQTAGVESIIDTVVTELIADPKKRFTQVEMKFFQLWWSEASDSRRDQVRTLVQEGRLEFVNAGWSMHDEACTHHDDIMNNMMMGHQWLASKFGDYARPKVGWHIDPFGHSNANPRLFAEMGFDAWFFARIDYEDKAVRMDNQSMQWVWKPFNESLGDQVSIFTHCMPDHYHQPADLRYDENYWGTDPVVTNANLSTFNADDKMESLRQYILDDATHFQTNRLMIPWGDDFHFSNAHITFKNLENTISYFNEKYDDITLLYSTPSEYVKALQAQQVEWPVRYDDMFPYADQNEDYWTGYFTSRADAKKQDRQTQANFHASTKLSAQVVIQEEHPEVTGHEVFEAKRGMMDALGIMQHHDAITGTAKQAVADRYAEILTDAVAQNNELYSKLIGLKASHAGLAETLEWSACTVQTTSPVDCGIGEAESEADSWMIAAHNPSTVNQSLLRFSVPQPSDGSGYVAQVIGTDQTWVDAPSDLLCYFATEDTVSADQVKACELFIKTQVAGQQIAYLKVSKSTEQAASRETEPSNDTLIENEHLRIESQDLDSAGRSLFRFHDLVTGDLNDMAFSLMYYNPATGNDGYSGSDNCASGAYIFKPMRGDSDKKAFSSFVSKDMLKGANTGVQAFILYYRDDTTGEMYTTLIRLMPGAQAVEWEVQLHSIPLGSFLSREGKEVVVNWEMLDFDNESTFYTDSNGLEMQKRVLNYRPDFELSTDEYASSNYYPINSAIVIRKSDSDLQLTIMNDRSQGGSVLSNGSVELMQNRRLLHDDWRGVGEALNEENRLGVGIQVNTRYFLQLFDTSKIASVQRKVQLTIDEPVSYFVAEATSDALSESKAVSAKPLPAFDGDLKIHLLPNGKRSMLIRLENLADLFDGTPESTPMFNLREYAMNVYEENNPQVQSVQVDIVERNLSDNQDYAEMVSNKFAWPTVDGPSPVTYPADQEPNAIVALQPQRIRLFRVTYTPLSTQEVFLQ